ncbi:N-acetylmuramoyl-L-alanine amidase [Streptomyces sp. NPDC050164]|uniref:N-acetylmuramoyl-L-alanine amidase n=1 Tax=Streptomyces sp. NPDC050164 TaxID=3365605 RepID=UPI00379F7D43
MAWYARATKMELQPESDAQPAIRPTQLIVHSIVGPWTPRRTYEYWRDSTSLESHFGLGYDGDIAQYIGTETRADANAQANRRPDGTGAVSVETASNTSASDPWTDEQVEELIRLGVWMHQRHGVPLRICRTHSDPGFGYHSLFPQWSTSGTACPGPARIKQFRTVVFPGIVARATGKPTEEDDVALTDADVKKFWYGDHIPAVAPPYNNADWNEGNRTWTAKYALHTVAASGRETLARVKALEHAAKQLLAQGAARDAVLAKLAEGGGLTTAEIKAAAEAGAQAALDKLGDALTKES